MKLPSAEVLFFVEERLLRIKVIINERLLRIEKVENERVEEVIKLSKYNSELL